MKTEAASILSDILSENTRWRTTAKGLARSLVWKNGVPPADLGQNFGQNLSDYLLIQSDRLLLTSLRLIESDDREQVTLGRTGFRNAAEGYESLLRNGNTDDPRRSLNSVLCAACYHLAGYAASAYSSLRTVSSVDISDNMISALRFLIQRNFSELDKLISNSANRYYQTESRSNTESVIADDIDEDDAICQNFLHCIALFLFSIRFDSAKAFDEFHRRITVGERFALETGDVRSRLIYTISRPLIREIWRNSILRALPETINGIDSDSWQRARIQFARVLCSRKISEIELWPSQIDAVKQVFSNNDSFAATLPTSAGKTRIAEVAILKSLKSGGRVMYITPLRALSAQIERGLRRLFGPLGHSVSALYGAQGISSVDHNTFADYDIVVATPEKAGFALRNAPELYDNINLIIFDEAHLIGSENRGIAYESFIVTLKRRGDSSSRRLIALSALLPEIDPVTGAFALWISNGVYQNPVISPKTGGDAWRPTRQCFGQIRPGNNAGDGFRYEIDVGGEISWLENFVVRTSKPPIGRKRKPTFFPNNTHGLALASAMKLLANQKSVLIYCPQARSVEKVCVEYLAAISEGFLDAFPIPTHGAEAMGRAIRIAEEVLPHGSNIINALQNGLAVHHAQLPRTFLREIDRLIANSTVRVVAASPTVNAGLNIAATCVLFNGFGRGEMERFSRRWGPDGYRLKVLEGSESLNVAGRAGRAFVDTHGEVLGVCFDEKHMKHWTNLRLKIKERSFTSGIVIVLKRLLELLSDSDVTASQLKELITNQPSIFWGSPPLGKKGESISDSKRKNTKWAEAVQSIDQAILALISNLDDASDSELAIRLDEALASSFFQSAIKDQNDDLNCIFLFRLRAKTLWRESSAEQRKGWFFAGLGLHDGKLLDAAAEIVAPFIVQVEEALAGDNLSNVVDWLVKAASYLFEIPSFSPKDGLPDGWEGVFRKWIEGISLQFIFCEPKGQQPLDDDYRTAARFIEDGIVYRLTWALEAVRVRRPDLMGEDPLSPRSGLKSAALLEIGTLDTAVAVLMQSGLASKRVAQEVTVHEGISRLSAQTIRGWVREQRNAPPERWSYIDAAIRPLWLDFISEVTNENNSKWHETHQMYKFRDDQSPPRWQEGSLGCLIRTSKNDRIIGVLQQMDGTRVSDGPWPFSLIGPDIAEAVSLSNGTFRLTYHGPSTNRAR